MYHLNKKHITFAWHTLLNTYFYIYNMSTYLTRDFWLVSAGNFFLFLSFYALLPLLPFYLAEEYGADGAMTGLILGVYMVALVAIRPVAGYLLDVFSRKPIIKPCLSLRISILYSFILCKYTLLTTTKLALFLCSCKFQGKKMSQWSHF